jgi:hypothetical protein
MKRPEYKNDKAKSTLGEQFPVYNSREELENARLLEAIQRTASEKFRFLMVLMKMNNSMRKTTIHRKPGT